MKKFFGWINKDCLFSWRSGCFKGILLRIVRILYLLMIEYDLVIFH